MSDDDGSKTPEEQAEAFERARQAFDRLVAAIEPYLGALPFQPDAVASLQPAATDYDEVFTADVADRARAEYERLWRESPPKVNPARDQVALDIWAAPAFAFAEPNILSRSFPGGYQHIAGYLQPGRVWLRWRYRRPDATSGLSFDGLVHTGTRWVWCPKPYRVLGPLIAPS